jgi:hypothetical protein
MHFLTGSDHFFVQVLEPLYTRVLRGMIVRTRQLTVVNLPAFCGAEEGRVFTLCKQIHQLQETFYA